jgi:ParB-like chromosome segregation protein Spo0J
MNTTNKSWRDVLKVHPAADLFPLMSADELKVLGEDIKKNGLRTQVTTWTDGDGNLWLIDGRNRLDALELAGLNLVKGGKFKNELPDQYVRDCDDPYAAAVSLNIHRRHLTAEQKRDLIAKLLKATPEKSDRQIAEMVKVDHKTVGAVREQVEGRGEIPHVPARTDTKGRKQPAKKKRRTEDDFKRDIAAKKTTETAVNTANTPISIDTETEPVVNGLPAGISLQNPITRAWAKATAKQRSEFALTYREVIDGMAAEQQRVIAERAERKRRLHGPEPVERAAASPAAPPIDDGIPDFLRRITP